MSELNEVEEGSKTQPQPAVRGRVAALRASDRIRMHFRDDLRAARYAALRDTEDFDPIIHVVERLGCYLE